MAFIHGKDAAVLYDDKDVTSYFREFNANPGRSLAPVTTFGNSGERFAAGLRDGEITLTGYFDSSGSHAELYANLVATTDKAITLAPEGLAFGKFVESTVARQASYDAPASVDEAVGTTINITSDGGIDAGVSLHALTAETASSNSTGSDNGAASSNGGAAFLHVTANTRDAGSIAIIVEHSTDSGFTAPTTIASFTSVAAAATTSERVAVAAGSTVNRYIRCKWTVTGGTTGSYTFHVNFARR